MMTWSKAGVIAEALGSMGIVFTLFYSVWSFKTTLRDAYYAEIDRVYFELLKIGLERPELLTYPTSPTSPASPDPAKASQYGAYAFMVWNFVETIFDRCQGWSKRRLRETWYPIIASENALHRAWFELPENRRRFKQRFVRFIEKRYPVAGGARAAAVEAEWRGVPTSLG
jgi:hypothetical protein